MLQTALKTNLVREFLVLKDVVCVIKKKKQTSYQHLF